jgi:23S rRNA (cytidine1920-2'-O)/16S rRNA (cytidine1409-2'-O)-methyltransferase
MRLDNRQPATQIATMSSASTRQRLDQALVARGLVATRARARDLILRGKVRVGDRTAGKPSLAVGPDDEVAIAHGAADYVSRGALKLAAALDHFGFHATGRIALDVGASTGGFTEILLRAGAVRVYAVDNGHGQLHPRLQADSRVIGLEGTDARRLDRSLVPEPIGALVADVSFISLAKALPAALALAAPGCWLVALVKPQFEAGRGHVPRSGVVRDPATVTAAVTAIESWLGSQSGWRICGTIAAPVLGGDGNAEFLLGAIHES